MLFEQIGKSHRLGREAPHLQSVSSIPRLSANISLRLGTGWPGPAQCIVRRSFHRGV